MSKEPRPWAEMATLCEALVADLAPHCERLEPAGSLRRHKPLVADLELVAIPRLVPVGLFGTETANGLYLHLREQEEHYRFLKGDNPAGRYFQVAVLGADGRETQVDLFTAEPDNFGWIWLIRTGCAEFSHAVLTRWKAKQGLGKEQPGSVDGRLVTRSGSRMETPEEADVFRLVGLEVIDPRRRVDGVLVGR